MKRQLHPVDVSMWIDGAPVFVISIHITTSGRFTIRHSDGVYYSFNPPLRSSADRPLGVDIATTIISHLSPELVRWSCRLSRNRLSDQFNETVMHEQHLE